ncbi:hypothetical protein [Streptomyces sp. 3213.3]|uniref:hypothetical protein n=1 Tax=Streptomyces sp. 3213.3 TaxID=1855348 RepID=UPI00190EFAE4|nr:hypothetical protein [Streptomyces sp. 3213.3]
MAFASLHYRVSGTVPEKGRLTAEASMETKPAVMTMVMTVAGARKPGELDIRFVDKAIYVGGSGVDASKLGGKSWFKAEPAVWGRGGTVNQSYGVLPGSMEGSPVAQSTVMVGSQDVRRIGAETVDGTMTMDLWVDGDGHPKQYWVRGKTYPTQNDADGGTAELGGWRPEFRSTRTTPSSRPSTPVTPPTCRSPRPG